MLRNLFPFLNGVKNAKPDIQIKEKEISSESSPLTKSRIYLSLSVIILIILLLLIIKLGLPSQEAPAQTDLEKIEVMPEHISKMILFQSLISSFHLSKSDETQLLQEIHRHHLDSLLVGSQVQWFFEDSKEDRLSKIIYTPLPNKEYIINPKVNPMVQVVQKQINTTWSTQDWVLSNNMLMLLTDEKYDQDLPWEVVQDIEDILSWSIGLRNLGKGDTIILVWEHYNYQGQPSNSYNRSILALGLKAMALDTTLYAFYYDYKDKPGYYDYDARPWKRKFLCSPITYGRISSRYNLSRLHPILKRIKAHRGTDFAAPQGAELYALADGEILERRLKGANGNYIKIKHDSIYSTAYLHLSKFKEGIEVGDFVKQGQCIGYVGQTGSATGPHVCLRFWRRDFQDDFVGAFPYLPKPDRLPLYERQKFIPYRDSLLQLMKQHQY